MSDSRPAVSCVLPTYARRSFLEMALQCFADQTFRDAELIVVEDSEKSVEGQYAGQDRVKHVRLNRRTNLGLKLNIGIECARGEIIQKLDDDDYYAPEFLKTAVAPFLNGDIGSTRTLVAWDCFSVLLGGAPPLRFSGHGWCAGGTFCFPRRLYPSAPFRDVPRNVDWFFLRDHEPEVLATCAPELYMLVRHGRNTWSTDNQGHSVDDAFLRMPAHSADLAGLVGSKKYDFYRELIEGTAELEW